MYAQHFSTHQDHMYAVSSNGPFGFAGEMQSPRWLFQAIALPNGSALAIGGLSIAKGGVLNSTEMFIPATNGSLKGSWKSVAAMNTPRQDFAALAMEDGTVMAVGGFMASTEIYDPEKVSCTLAQADLPSELQWTA